MKVEEITKFTVKIGGLEDLHLVDTIISEIEISAKERGTGIARRSTTYLEEKILEGKAVIALTQQGDWAGFCYIETWSEKTYVANSGLIVKKAYRNSGLAKQIKQFIFQYSRKLFPQAKLFGLTTGLAVMKINSELGYRPVTYSELTQDEVFWSGCKSCVNFEILSSKQRKNCLCTAMLYDPSWEQGQPKNLESSSEGFSLTSKFDKIKKILWKK